MVRDVCRSDGVVPEAACASCGWWSVMAAQRMGREALRRLWLASGLPPMVQKSKLERWGAFVVQTHRPGWRTGHDDRYEQRRASRSWGRGA